MCWPVSILLGYRSPSHLLFLPQVPRPSVMHAVLGTADLYVGEGGLSGQLQLITEPRAQGWVSLHYSLLWR